MDYKAKVAEAEKLLDRVAELLEKGSHEEKEHIPEMIADAKKLQAEATQMKSVEDARSELLAFANDNGGGAQQSYYAKSSYGRRNQDWKTVGSFFKSVYEANRNGANSKLKRFQDNDEKAAEAKDMTGATGAGGGFLIPVEYSDQLMGVVGENSIVRPLATIIPMRRRQVAIPVLDQTGTTAGQGHWFGGLRVYWAEEGSQKTSSDATFRQNVLTAWKMIMFTRASDELLDDSAVSLAAFLAGNMGFVGAINWYEDFAFIQGSGVGQPLGVINSGAFLTHTRAGGSAITYPDLTGMMKKFLPNAKGTWTISQSAMAQLLELAGPSGNASYLWGSAVQGAPGTLLGYPVRWSEKNPVLGAVGDIILADWSYYLIGDRQATTVESTKFERWEYDETSWRAVHRVDGRPWLSTYITLQDGSTTVSPFVGLTT